MRNGDALRRVQELSRQGQAKQGDLGHGLKLGRGDELKGEKDNRTRNFWGDLNRVK